MSRSIPTLSGRRLRSKTEKHFGHLSASKLSAAAISGTFVTAFVIAFPCFRLCAAAKARAFRGSELDQRSRQCDPIRRACAEFCAGLASGVSTRQLRLCSSRRVPVAERGGGVAQGRG